MKTQCYFSPSTGDRIVEKILAKTIIRINLTTQESNEVERFFPAQEDKA